jgi:hypothetical protein
MAGTIWMAEAPVPMTATRLPVRSASWFQREEWKISPLKPSMPLMSGSEGSHNAPTAETTIFATNSPLLVLTCHRADASSQRAERTSQSKMCLSSTLWRLATDWMYL